MAKNKKFDLKAYNDAIQHMLERDEMETQRMIETTKKLGRSNNQKHKPVDTGVDKYGGYHKCPNCGIRHGQINDHINHMELCNSINFYF